MTICKIEGCTKNVGVKKFQLCYAHYQRQRTGAVMDSPIQHYRPEGIPGYIAAHERLRKLLGPASGKECVDCEGPAAHWSLTADSDRIQDTWTSMAGKWYSLDCFDYEARCVRDHTAYDQKHGLSVNPIGMHS